MQSEAWLQEEGLRLSGLGQGLWPLCEAYSWLYPVHLLYGRSLCYLHLCFSNLESNPLLNFWDLNPQT